jgi:hypothetical protein
MVPQSGSSSTESNWNLEMLIFAEGGIKTGEARERINN